MEEQDKIINMLDAHDYDGALREIMEVYGRRVLYLIQRIVQHLEDAQDLYQDVMIIVYKYLPSFKRESKIYTWIYKIAMREAVRYNEVKRRKYQFQEISVYDEIALKTYQVTKNESQLWNQFYHAINQLPEKQKMVFLLRYFDELSYKDISIITNDREGTLKTNYHFAVEKIKNILSNEN